MRTRISILQLWRRLRSLARGRGPEGFLQLVTPELRLENKSD